jgi:glycine betaine/proline transport system ATP-binding protein
VAAEATPNGAETHIEVEDLSKVFGPDPQSIVPLLREGVSKDDILARTGHTVGLRDISLRVQRGETFVVMGLSGSGKSTLVRCLNRLIDPTIGSVRLDGEDVLALGPRGLRDMRRHKMGMVFQRFGLLPHRTVLANVTFGLRVQGVGRTERREQASAWIERVGLAGYEHALPRELSGGMQQRVGLARALCTNPEVLLMDEAFSALDPLIRREMQGELVRLQQELSKTIVFITHDLDEALRLGDRVAVLKDGFLVQVGTPVEIVTRPPTTTCARSWRTWIAPACCGLATPEVRDPQRHGARRRCPRPHRRECPRPSCGRGYARRGAGGDRRSGRTGGGRWQERPGAGGARWDDRAAGAHRTAGGGEGRATLGDLGLVDLDDRVALGVGADGRPPPSRRSCGR